MNEQELQTKFKAYEQQIMQLQQQLQQVDQAIVEIDSLEKGLDDLIDKKDTEVLASLGKGIFAKTKLTSNKLLVDVGEKSFVEKTIPQTQELIKEQVQKLENIKEELENELEKINNELTQTMINFQNQRNDNGCDCSHDEECKSSCEDNCECN